MNKTVEEWALASPVPTIETRQLWIVVVALVVAWGLSWAWTRRVRGLALVPPLALGAIAVARALQTAWIADDAYITFRYSANWARGLGPVWNVGERVEGYTNPLWMAVLALGELLGAPSPWLAPALNLVLLFALIAGCWWGLQRAFPGSDVLPVLPVVLALSPAIREFGTSGLETLPASAAVAFAALSLLLGKRPLIAGLLVCVAAMLRPDHALFFAPLGFAVVSTGSLKQRFQNATQLIAPAVIFTLFWVVRWRWYGDFYPNTYYAKSASIPYWQQGSIYVAEFVASTRLWWPVVLAPLAALGLWLAGRRGSNRLPAPSPSRAPFFVFSVGGGLLWLLYVARVGGDFMEFRFALTALPVLGLAADVLLWSQWRAPFAARVLASLVVLLPLAQAEGLIRPLKKTEHIARESTFYPVKTWSPLVIDSGSFRQAKGLAEANAPHELMALGCVGMIGYYNLDLPIFDTYGKASREVARRPVVKRGRPGHEKTATLDDLRRAGVVWSIDPLWPAFNKTTSVSYPDGQAWLVRLAPSVVAWAKTRGRVIDGAQILRQLTDVDAVVEHLDAVELLFERDPKALEAHLASLGVVPPNTFQCDEARNHCGAALTCEDSLLELEGEPSCTLSGGGASNVRSLACDGATSVTVTCAAESRAKWVLTRGPVALSDRVAKARRFGARSVANVMRHRAEPASAVLDLGFETEGFPGSFRVTGDAMVVTQGTADRQADVRGFRGAALLNTYARGDAAKGELNTTLQLDGDREYVASALVAGSSNCTAAFLELIADGKSLGPVCGTQDEQLRLHAWFVPPGTQKLEVRIVDASSAGWGHLLVDDVGVWQLP